MDHKYLLLRKACKDLTWNFEVDVKENEIRFHLVDERLIKIKFKDNLITYYEFISNSNLFHLTSLEESYFHFIVSLIEYKGIDLSLFNDFIGGNCNEI